MTSEEKNKITRLIRSLIQAMNIGQPADSHAWGLMLFPDYSVLHTLTHTHSHTHTHTNPPTQHSAEWA